VAGQVAWKAKQKKEAKLFDNDDNVTVSAAPAATTVIAKDPQTAVGCTATAAGIGKRSAVQFGGGRDTKDFGTT